MRLYLLLFLLFPFGLSSRELPPIVCYEPETYHGGTQNWMISQDENGIIYAANNEGLLEFNGSNWRLYPTSNESIIRSVHAQGDRIYTGNYMDFGYWKRDPTGQLKYSSLVDKVKKEIIPDAQIWKIIGYQKHIIFQSLQQFFLFDLASEEIQTINIEGSIAKLFQLEDNLYFSDEAGGLYKLQAGEINTVLPPGQLSASIVHLWMEEKNLNLQTVTTGSYRILGEQAIATRVHPFLVDKRIYTAIPRKQGGHVFGTISNGIYVTAANGSLEYHIDQEQGLTNNTILSLFQDRHRNIWAGTDNGISCLNISSPFRKFTDRTGRLGTVHASAQFKGRLYLGSNQGLFVETRPGSQQFRLIEGTLGQVWALYHYNDQLFCGHNSGTYLVNGQNASLISDIPGTWNFAAIPGRPELLLQGNFAGLSVLENRNNQWRLRNQISGFDYSARFLELLPGQQVFISHEYRGTFGLQLDTDYRKVLEQKDYQRPSKGKNSSLAAFGDSIYHYSREGLYVLQNFTDGFKRSLGLNEQLAKEEYTSGQLSAANDRLWFFSRNNISYFQRGALSSNLKRHAIPVDAELINAKSGYENITPIGRDTLLIGTTDGYLTLLPKVLPDHRHEIFLNQVSQYLPETDSFRLLALAGALNIPFTKNDLAFSFSVPNYAQYFHPLFQYRLLGKQEDWTSWSKKADLQFQNLNYGSYTLEVRSRIGNQLSENIVAYSFTVSRPWYATYLAIALYFIGAISFIYLLHSSYTGYYRRKERDWKEAAEKAESARRREAELELTRVQNDLLQKDVENKKRESALATLTLVKKNELLQLIKKKLLAKQSPELNIEQVVKTIDQNLDDTESWNLFKEAFENTDHDFLKKIKSLHPQLTPNDLKVCSYLRLNLSTKEIASALNISGRSVEVKRSRLRKKMGLSRKQGLVDYILGL